VIRKRHDSITRGKRILAVITLFLLQRGKGDKSKHLKGGDSLVRGGLLACQASGKQQPIQEAEAPVQTPQALGLNGKEREGGRNLIPT